MNDLYPDFIEFLKALADNAVEFVVVGAYAVAFYGHPRATKDIDILVRSDPENARRLYKALADFGAPLRDLNVAEEDLHDYSGILQLGVAPQRIDVINRISGVTYDEAIAEAERFDLQGRSIGIIGLNALLKNKSASGRHQDLADVAALNRGSHPRNDPSR